MQFGSKASASGAKPTAQERLIRLLEYIEQVEKMNRVPLFDVPNNFYCAYEENLRALPDVEFDVASEDIWLRVPRLKEREPPEPSAALRPWVVLKKTPDDLPTLREEIAVAPSNQGDPTRRLSRKDVPQVDALFQHYVKGMWNKWAADERPRRNTIATYNKLFVLHQALESEGTDTPLELVWGLGVAVWKHPSGRVVRYPLITQLVEIGLDSDTLALDVRPRERLPNLETDAFAALEVTGVASLEATWKGYLNQAEVVLSPFDAKSAEAILKPAAGFLDAAGIYWPDAQSTLNDRVVPTATQNLIITDTWVLFARKRSPSFLIDDLQRLRKSLEGLVHVPEGPAALVTELSDELLSSPRLYFRGRCYSGAELSPGETVRELYFPKPYNNEQVSIIEKLERSPGVVVQGPPGTGKTHTIANVICHYLANGKRVLVTSKGEPALAVLRDQIPETIRALTVALLTDERDGMRQFEHAIQTIAGKVAGIQPDDLDRQTQTLEQRLEELHSRLAGVDHDIAQWARRHLEKITFGGRSIMPEELARLIVEREAEHAWFPDALKGDFVDPEFTEADIQAIRMARRVLGRDLAYLDCDLPRSSLICEPSEIDRIHRALVRSKELARKIENASAVPFLSTDKYVLEKAERLVEELLSALETYDDIYSQNIPGTEALHRAYERDARGALDSLDTLVEQALEIEQWRQAFVARPVDIPPDGDIDVALREAVERLGDGRSAVSLFSFGSAKLKARLGLIKVSGLAPVGQDDWGHVMLALNCRRTARAFVARWNAAADEVHLPAAELVDPESFRSVLGLVEHARKVRSLAVEHRKTIVSLCHAVFGPARARKDVTITRMHMESLWQTLEDQLTHLRLEQASAAVENLMTVLSGKGGAVIEAMLEFLKKELGQADVEQESAVTRWSVLLSELRRLESLRGAFDEVKRVSQLIERSGAGQWAHSLRANPVISSVDPWVSPTWLEAWHWRQGATFVDTIDGRKALKALQAQRKTAEADLAHTYQSLVETKTWREVYRNSPPAVKAALQAYLNAVRAIGKGTGIRAIRHRRAARAAMLEAYRAVPCWILPQWRVSETLPPEIGKFDLVIVDEASQSDLWVLPALLRGVKVMVVGDDKQVSPDGIGLSEERIKDLKNRFLSDQAHGEQMTPEKSMYDLAKVVFAGEMVMLREHFRCVPSIIEFSKREFYNHEIQPLRVPKRTERLDPPLIDVFVHGGARADKVNSAEARAIVNEIKAIIADPACKNRSIGVVSLLGMEQAHRIFELVREEIPAEEIVGRKMTVGDARTFQGKERDIMLLSMVATPEHSVTVTARMYEQRFNVAASRARDRMYLFRSVELDDLSKFDLKAKLIEHFRTPFHQDPRRTGALRELCQSDFERAMFDDLTNAGYCVKPQVPVGGYSIDLVVEGTEDRRLAVECDGDKYHGPERWSHDMARQRILERAGWSFWRCFGASFNRDRQGMLADLFGTLRGMGIEPIGSADIDLGVYSEHRVVRPAERHGPAREAISAATGADPVEAPPIKDLQQVEANGTGPAQSDRNPLLNPPTNNSPAALKAKELTKQVHQPKPGTQGVIPLQGGKGQFSDSALMEFLNRYSMQSEDNRPKAGALWVWGNGSPDISRQLKAWGFAFTPKRGWWKK